MTNNLTQIPRGATCMKLEYIVLYILYKVYYYIRLKTSYNQFIAVSVAVFENFQKKQPVPVPVFQIWTKTGLNRTLKH